MIAACTPAIGYLHARQMRARRIDADDADFLAEIAMDEILARIKAVNRQFSHALDFCSTGPRSAAGLGDMLPAANVDRVGMPGSLENSGGPDHIDLAENEYDLAVSVFGLHWCGDLPAVLRKIHRSLKPDGLFMCALPGRGTLDELRQSLLAAEAGLTGGAAMRVDRFPDLNEGGRILQSAGFALPVADVEKLTLRYGDVAQLVGELRAIGSAARSGRTNRPLPRDILVHLDRLYRKRYGDADGRIRTSVNVIYLTGWTPHESQQKPLAPGSAETRLASVLKRTWPHK